MRVKDVMEHDGQYGGKVKMRKGSRSEDRKQEEMEENRKRGGNR